MFEILCTKFRQMSELPAFNGGTAEHAFFVTFCVAIALCATFLIVLVIRAIVKGIVEIWKLRCDVKQRTLDTSVKIQQELTEQTRITGRKPQN